VKNGVYGDGVNKFTLLSNLYIFWRGLGRMRIDIVLQKTEWF